MYLKCINLIRLCIQGAPKYFVTTIRPNSWAGHYTVSGSESVHVHRTDSVSASYSLTTDIILSSQLQLDFIDINTWQTLSGSTKLLQLKYNNVNSIVNLNLSSYHLSCFVDKLKLSLIDFQMVENLEICPSYHFTKLKKFITELLSFFCKVSQKKVSVHHQEILVGNELFSGTP